MILNTKRQCGKKELVGGVRGEDLFWKYHEYVRNLSFDEEPDYSYL